MRKLLFIALIAFFSNAKAQITLEHDYDSASTYSSGSPALMDQLMIINFEISGERYVRINRHGKTICIYDMNHSLIKTIDFSSFPQASTANNYLTILYFSENLFDTDSGTEFMYIANTGTPYTGIYNDDGSLIFSDNCAPLTPASWPPQQYPIYNTSNGTKMILSYQNMNAKVFSLPGILSTSIENTNNNLLSQNSISNAYPNPSLNSTQIDYALPNGTNQGEIVFYNIQGKEVKRFKVDNTFNSLIISTSDLSTGTYYYQLQTTGQSSAGKKMVVIK